MEQKEFYEALREENTQLALALAKAGAESRLVDTEIQRWVAKLGKEILRILEQYGPDLPPDQADRLLRLVVLRSLLAGDERVQSLGRSLPALRDVLLGPGHREQEPASGLDVAL